MIRPCCIDFVNNRVCTGPIGLHVANYFSSVTHRTLCLSWRGSCGYPTSH